MVHGEMVAMFMFTMATGWCSLTNYRMHASHFIGICTLVYSVHLQMSERTKIATVTCKCQLPANLSSKLWF